MQWQSDLLEYSWKRVDQPGELIRLVATDSDTLPTHRYARAVRTPSARVHPLTGDDYPPYNKPASVLEWLRTDQPSGTVLLLDPDCVFRAPIDREVSEGHPVAQRWVGLSYAEGDDGFGLGPRFAFLRHHGVRPRIRAQLGMIPKLIHTKDLERIAARWLELTALVRQEVTDRHGRPMWESDMFAYAIVAGEAGLEHELASLGVCTNWSPTEAAHAPIIHYCQPIDAKDGESIWSKHHYRPWERVADPQRARHDYGRDLLTLLNRCVTSRAGADLEGSRPTRRVGVREIREASGMVLRVPGRNREFILNHAGQRIWELCDGIRTMHTLREELQREFQNEDGGLDDALAEALAALHDAALLRFERG